MHVCLLVWYYRSGCKRISLFRKKNVVFRCIPHLMSMDVYFCQLGVLVDAVISSYMYTCCQQHIRSGHFCLRGASQLVVGTTLHTSRVLIS